jgi:S1-C subfamily serine protease
MKSLKHILLILTFLSISLYSSSNSVIKIFTTKAIANYKSPWQVSKISRYTGSGAIISKKRILTSAHVVAGAKLISIQKENDSKKYVATIEYISHQADLAILTLKERDFFQDTKPLKLTTNIKTGDKVTVLGYPLGGNNISTTTGVVSRIEYRRYVASSFDLLAIQIDAAINSGNSGGPVINSKNELVGIAMMKLLGSSNISYIVPSIVINTFLQDTKDGKVDGFNNDGTYVQNINNDAEKKFFGLKSRTGVLITSIDIDEKVVKVNDIILAINDHIIANDGTIKTQYSRVNFNFIYHTKQIGQTVKLNILRDKKEIVVKHTLRRTTPLLNYEFAKEPRYIIYGGFTFVPITKNYLYSLKRKKGAFKMLFYNKNKTKDYTEPVAVLSSIFPHEVNRGYYINSYVLLEVNGIKIKSFSHLVSVLDHVKDEFTVFKFLEKSKIILNTKEAKNSIDEIMNTYYIKKDRRK